MKTTTTLVDKLRRQSVRLSQIQDLAGARIVVSDLEAQDRAVERIREEFDDQQQRCKVYDRRKNPSHGYRAVHVIVLQDGIPVEVQVRTDTQDAWAQIMERLADQWGRDIRYGGDPDQPELPAGGNHLRTRRTVVQGLIDLGDSWAEFEETRRRVKRTQAEMEAIRKMLASEHEGARQDEPATEKLLAAVRTLRERDDVRDHGLPDALTRGQAAAIIQTELQHLIVDLEKDLGTLEADVEDVRGSLQLLADAAEHEGRSA